MTEANTMGTMMGVNCPSCHSEIVIGIGIQSPVFIFALTAAQIETKRLALETAVRGSSLPQEAKDGWLKQFGEPGTPVDPTEADRMISSLQTHYGTKEENVAVVDPMEESPKPIPKKPRGTPKATS